MASSPSSQSQKLTSISVMQSLEQVLVEAEEVETLEAIDQKQVSAKMTRVQNVTDSLMQLTENDLPASTIAVLRRRAGDMVHLLQSLAKMRKNPAESNSQLESIITQLKSSIESKRCQGASQIWKLAYNDPEVRNEIGGSGVIPLLLDCLRSEYHALLERATGALATLASRCDENKKRMVDAGAIELLRKHLINCSNHSIVINVIQCLNNIAVGSQHKDLVATADIIEKLRAYATDPESHEENVELRENASITLTNVTM